MDYQSLHMKTVAELRQLAREYQVRLPAGVRKAEMIERILEHASDAKAVEKKPQPAQATADAKSAKSDGQSALQKAEPAVESGRESAVKNAVESCTEAETVETSMPPRPQSAHPRVGNRSAAQTPGRVPQRSFAPYANRAPRTYEARRSYSEAYRPQNGEPQAKSKPQENVPTANRAPRTYEARRSYSEAYRPQNGEPQAESKPQENVPNAYSPRPAAEYNSEERGVNSYAAELMASGECGDGAGVLEIHADGYGFLRAENYLPGNKDVYVSAAQIRRFNLRTGDYVVGKTRAQMAGDRSVGLIYINEINGKSPEFARRRRPFDTLVPVYPDERLRMEIDGENNVSLRLIDMIAPIGKGQRGMIVSQPKAGKTTLLKNIANSITHNHPEVHLIVLLIDERPEEVTEMKRCIQGEVVYSTFDEAPENHTRVSEMVLERAQRLVELGKDVVILLDSITRLARAYNLVIPPTGRSLSGGLDPGALYKPKRFFGAARNIENGGSLTIIATALVDTGSRMDDIIFEEFKGTGNMELHLDRSLSDRRIFPAIDLFKSGTRREELLLSEQELDGAYQVRRMLARGNAQEAAEQLISMVEKSKCNRDFFSMLTSWKNANKKDGFNESARKTY